jgi:phage shock protein PspC (stress-responsive transcriptional regulator)
MVKKLYRIEQGKVLCGVCGGLGEYFNIDENLIRLIFVLLGCTGTGIIAYIVGALLIPPKSQTF